jgi:hypothetical protein
MIPLACPQCGRRGSIPADKMNSRLHCKKCDAVFHLDPLGHILLGEPGRAMAQPGGSSGFFGMAGHGSGEYARTGSGGVATLTATRPATSRRTELPGVWECLPKSLKAVIFSGLVLVLAWACGVRLPFRGEPLPPTLEQRIGVVAEAFAYNEPASLRRVAVDGTQEDLNAWLAKLRPAAAIQASREPGSRVTYIHQFVSGGGQNDTHARAMVFVVPPSSSLFDPDDQSAQSAQTERIRRQSDAFAPGPLLNGAYALPLVWKVVDGEWRLDGTACLQAAANTTLAAHTRRPPR